MHSLRHKLQILLVVTKCILCYITLVHSCKVTRKCNLIRQSNAVIMHSKTDKELIFPGI
jgi:hypothetical protein